jgi:hypothetical protein
MGGACNGYWTILMKRGLEKTRITENEIPKNNFRFLSDFALKATISNIHSQIKGLKKMPMILLKMNMGIKIRPVI